MSEDGRMTRATVIVPIAAGFAATLAAIQIVADSGFAFCGNRVAMAMPGMDMSMPMDGSVQHGLTICPFALLLIVVAALFAALASVLVWCDPEPGRAVLAFGRRLYLVLVARSEALAGYGTIRFAIYAQV